MQDATSFEGIDNDSTFFTTQERQWLVLRLLESIRAKHNDSLPGLDLLEGQPIGNIFFIIPNYTEYPIRIYT